MSKRQEMLIVGPNAPTGAFSLAYLKTEVEQGMMYYEVEFRVGKKVDRFQAPSRSHITDVLRSCIARSKPFRIVDAEGFKEFALKHLEIPANLVEAFFARAQSGK